MALNCWQRWRLAVSLMVVFIETCGMYTIGDWYSSLHNHFPSPYQWLECSLNSRTFKTLLGPTILLISVFATMEYLKLVAARLQRPQTTKRMRQTFMDLCFVYHNFNKVIICNEGMLAFSKYLTMHTIKFDSCAQNLPPLPSQMGDRHIFLAKAKNRSIKLKKSINCKCIIGLLFRQM